MGACYNIMFKTKVKDEEAAAKTLSDYIQKNADWFPLAMLKERGIDTSTFDGAIRAIFADLPYNCFERTETDDGWIIYDNGFDATYSWQAVMIDAFDLISPYVHDGTVLSIDGDSEDDYWVGTVNNHIL